MHLLLLVEIFFHNHAFQRTKSDVYLCAMHASGEFIHEPAYEKHIGYTTWWCA